MGNFIMHNDHPLSLVMAKIHHGQLNRHRFTTPRRMAWRKHSSHSAPAAVLSQVQALDNRKKKKKNIMKQGLGLMSLFGDLLNPSPNQISVGNEISPFELGDAKNWDIYQLLWRMMSPQETMWNYMNQKMDHSCDKNGLWMGNPLE